MKNKLFYKFVAELNDWLTGCRHIHGDEYFFRKYPKKMTKEFLARQVHRGVLKRPHNTLYHL